MTEALTSGPRPLQLASGSIINSRNFAAPASPSYDPNESTHGITTAETNLQKVESEDLDRMPASCTSPTTARAIRRSATRRHSSISYIHSDATSPLRESFIREYAEVSIKSPPSDTHQASSRVRERSPAPFLDSCHGPVARNFKDKRAANRRSHGSLLADSKVADVIKHLKERPPVTLTEKHAELLQFIAQKESKCLELRSQLSIHEAELLQLKRKWELIVCGFDKSQNSTSSNPSSALSPSSPFFNPLSASEPPSSPYFPLLPSGHAPVFEGIKEGVQGMSRLLVAGLETIAGGPIDPSQPLHQARASTLQPPLPLLLHKSSKRHGQKESQSSSSTIASTSTFESVADTNTSATSVRTSFSFDGSPPVTTSPTSTTQINTNGREGRHSLDKSEGQQSRHSTPSSDRSEQVLIVRDTGATPTMSPNPDFERKKRSKKLYEKEGGRRALTGRPVKKNAKKGDDEWVNSDELLSSPRNAAVNGQASSRSTTVISKPAASLPPMSGIPGLATMNLTGPTAQQVTSWMGTVGKKLGEIRGNSTFTKSQKRASLLLSDMQNTFVSSLISPPPTPEEIMPVAPDAVTSQASTTTSLLDDEFDGDLAAHTPVLVPSTPPEAKGDRPRQETKGDRGRRTGSESDDDWNW